MSFDIIRRSWLFELLFAIALSHGTGRSNAAPPHDADSLFGQRPSVLEELQGFSVGNSADPVQVDARTELDAQSQTGRLIVTATISPGFHISSLTQRKNDKGGGPNPTTIRLARNATIELTGPFTPDKKPSTRVDEEVWKGLVLEEFHDVVMWSAPFQVVGSVGTGEVRGVFETQACDANGCIPLKIDFVAPLPNRDVVADGSPASRGPNSGASIANSTPFREPGARAELSGRIHPSRATPGSSVEIMITATPDPDWHVYQRADRDPKNLGNKFTLLNIDSAGGLPVHAATTTAPIVMPKVPAELDLPATPFYKGPVTWTIQLDIPSDAAPGERVISGLIGYQTCAEQCDRPRGARFETKLDILPAGASPPAIRTSAPVTFTASKYSSAAALADAVADATSRVAAAPKIPTVVIDDPDEPTGDTNRSRSVDRRVATSAPDRVAPILIPGTYTSSSLHQTLREAAGVAPVGSVPETTDASRANQSFAWMLVLGFLGGIILNIMPCVLPVIGLKVFAFIEQAGESRARTFALNFWYSVGVISIFMVLAVLAVVFRLGWGQLFQFSQFNIAMAAVIFTMGLSFLGVWEIPIPGFIGTSKVTDIGEREGYEGAFAKGTITTLLATPCTGPFMGTALVGVLNRPTPEIFAIFFAIGLGMSSPYLLIGGFPELVRFLPKPGEWMNTFKQAMGFVLIGTVVYLLTLLKPHYVIPTVALLFGLWAACWWIGRVPITAPSDRRWRALGEGAMFATAIGLISMVYLSPIMESRAERALAIQVDSAIEDRRDVETGEFFVANEPWQPFSEQKLAWLQANGKTVLIDFTADWCLTCKALEKAVLRTDETTALLKELDIYTMVADWSHRDDSSEVTKKLEQYGAKQIPLLAIYPSHAESNRIPDRAGEMSAAEHGRSAR